MTAFYIKEDFPQSEIEFDKRFATESACYDYLFKVKWPDGFICSKCGHHSYWISSKHIYICTRCESHFFVNRRHDHASYEKTDHILV